MILAVSLHLVESNGHRISAIYLHQVEAMARPKARPTLQQRRFLGELEGVAAALTEAEAQRDRLIVEARRARATVEQIADAASISQSGVYKVLERMGEEASGS